MKHKSCDTLGMRQPTVINRSAVREASYNFMMAHGTKDGAGYSCNFVKQPPLLFICEVCELVLRQPHITQCCGKNACKSCIAKKANDREPCPIPGCENQCVKIIFNRVLHYDILKSKVYCTSKESSCEWVDTLENLEKHLLECQFYEVECQNSCGTKIQRKMVKEHEAVCERFPVKCEQCGNLYERRDQLNHLDTCSLTKVNCPFSIVGCTTEVLNKDMQQHFDEALSDHYALVAKQNQDLQAKIKAGGLMVKENLKPLSTRNSEIVWFHDEVQATEREIIKLQSALEEAQNEFSGINQRYSQLITELQQQIMEKETSIHAVREQCNQLELVSKERCYGPMLPHIHPADIVSRPLSNPETTEKFIHRISFSITRFEKERKNDTCLCSPPFFSHSRGYKMCLLVHCNGYFGFKGDYVSVEPRILSGQYDDELKWPLHCKIEVELRGIRAPSLKKIIVVNSQSPTPKDRFISKSLGARSYEHVLRLGATFRGYQLLSSYLRDGCLTIDVIKVTF